MLRLEIKRFGGYNINDLEEDLFARAYQASEQGFFQKAELESRNIVNMDYDPNGIIRRGGSTTDSDLSLVGDEVVNSYQWVNADGNTADLVCTTDTIYIRINGGSWQIIDDHGVPHSHSVTKCTFAEVDGHLFIGLDGGEYIHVYRTGTSLDDELSTCETTVDQVSAAGGAILYVASTGCFEVGEDVLVDGTDTYTIASIQVGVSLTMTTNLTGGPYGVGVTVSKVATYIEARDPTITYQITGTWDTDTYMLAEINSRLALSDGGVSVQYTPMQYTPSSGIWDMDNGGFFVASSPVVSMFSFVPETTNSLLETLYIGTTTGMELTTGFTSADPLYKIEGSLAPVNYRAFTKATSWVVYIDSQNAIKGINGTRIIDLGRRLKSADVDNQSVLDTADTSDTFLNYDKKKKHVYAYFSVDYVNDYCAVIDFTRGEPVFNEPQSSYEPRVRNLLWFVGQDWFISSMGDKMVAEDGVVYDVNTGKFDFDDVNISASWWSVLFNANLISRLKQFYSMDLRVVGNSDGTYKGIIDGGEPSTLFGNMKDGGTPSTVFTKIIDGGTPTMGQLIATLETSYDETTDTDTYNFDDYIVPKGVTVIPFTLDRKGDDFRLKISSTSSGETVVYKSIVVRFDIGAELR
jgi:hypothetical protein